MPSFKRFIVDHAGIIGYVILVLAITWALAWQHILAQQIEEEAEIRSAQIERESVARAHIHCVRQNQTRTEIGEILEILAAPRTDDIGHEFETRQELLRQTQALLLQEECPPEPNGAKEGENS